MKSINKIAIVKLSAMGDVIHAMLALQFLKQNNPELKIDWFVEKAFAEVLNLNPDISNVFILEFFLYLQNEILLNHSDYFYCNKCFSTKSILCRICQPSRY